MNQHNVNSGLNHRFRRFFLDVNRHTDIRTDPLTEMRERIKKEPYVRKIPCVGSVAERTKKNIKEKAPQKVTRCDPYLSVWHPLSPEMLFLTFTALSLWYPSSFSLFFSLSLSLSFSLFLCVFPAPSGMNLKTRGKFELEFTTAKFGNYKSKWLKNHLRPSLRKKEREGRRARRCQIRILFISVPF